MEVLVVGGGAGNKGGDMEEGSEGRLRICLQVERQYVQGSMSRMPARRRMGSRTKQQRYGRGVEAILIPREANSAAGIITNNESNGSINDNNSAPQRSHQVCLEGSNRARGRNQLFRLDADLAQRQYGSGLFASWRSWTS
jgi:hypothetical protein